MLHRLLPAACAALLAASACRSAEIELVTSAPRSSLSAAPNWEDLTIGPGDVLRVGVYGHPELSAPPHANTASGTQVDHQGMLSLPLVGAVPVAGLRMDEVRSTVSAAFAVYLQDPKVDVSVVEYAARRFHVYGEVQKPGAFVLDRPLSAYEGLSLAGPFTPRARRGAIVLLRGRGPEDLEVHVFDGEAPGAGGLVSLRPDDLLFVRRSGAGRFADEVLPILTGISSSLSSVATVLLIDDELNE